MQKQHIQLNETERAELQALLERKDLARRVYKRVIAILALEQGRTYESVAELLDMTNDTVRAWRQSYEKAGIAGLQDKPRPGRPIKFDGNQRAQITALACSQEPAGYSAWNFRLLADKVVELGFCASISHTQVRTILKKTN